MPVSVHVRVGFFPPMHDKPVDLYVALIATAVQEAIPFVLLAIGRKGGRG